MVVGLKKFSEHFSSFKEQYVLIGGAACDLAMDEAGVDFRGTKDLDIVLCAEALNPAFAKAFWEFITQGQYNHQEKSTGNKQFYRFQKPATEGYPAMLELFSRIPDIINVPEGSTLTPIPVDEEVSSLSAILLDDTYYTWIQIGRIELEEVSLVGPEFLVPLKARAWLDLSARKAAGERVDSRDVKKHKNDIFRLSQILDPDVLTETPEAVKIDMKKFIEGMAGESINLKALDVTGRTVEEIFESLRSIYELN